MADSVSEDSMMEHFYSSEEPLMTSAQSGNNQVQGSEADAVYDESSWFIEDEEEDELITTATFGSSACTVANNHHHQQQQQQFHDCSKESSDDHMARTLAGINIFTNSPTAHGGNLVPENRTTISDRSGRPLDEEGFPTFKFSLYDGNDTQNKNSSNCNSESMNVEGDHQYQHDFTSSDSDVDRFEDSEELFSSSDGQKNSIGGRMLAKKYPQPEGEAGKPKAYKRAAAGGGGGGGCGCCKCLANTVCCCCRCCCCLIWIIVIVAIVGAALGIGLYFWRKKKKTASFLQVGGQTGSSFLESSPGFLQQGMLGITGEVQTQEEAVLNTALQGSW